jgi:hypothetical protein
VGNLIIRSSITDTGIAIDNFCKKVVGITMVVKEKEEA